MNRTTYVVTAPTDEPLSVDDARGHVRLDSEVDDALLVGLITAAREWCENFLQRSLAPQTRAAVFDGWPIVIELLYGPVTAVDSITYVDTAGVTQTLASSSYQVDLLQDRARIVPAYGQTWPTLRTETLNPVKVTYQAGSTDCPAPIVQAMRLLVGHWYENREASVVGTSSASIPLGAEALLHPYSLQYPA